MIDLITRLPEFWCLNIATRPRTSPEELLVATQTRFWPDVQYLNSLSPMFVFKWRLKKTRLKWSNFRSSVKSSNFIRSPRHQKYHFSQTYVKQVLQRIQNKFFWLLILVCIIIRKTSVTIKNCDKLNLLWSQKPEIVNCKDDSRFEHHKNPKSGWSRNSQT